MPPPYCGLYPGRHCLIAVAVDSDGQASLPLRGGRSPEACWELLVQVEGVVGLDVELVLPIWLARKDSIAPLATGRGIPLWIVPENLTEDLHAIARAGGGARMATLLARLPLTNSLRQQLSRHRPTDQRQLQLALR